MMDLSVINDREKVERLQVELSKLPQYAPETKHYFHGGMYCREVYRDAGVLVVGKVHKKEHFYLIVSGLVRITSDNGVIEAGSGTLMLSKPGTKRAVLALEPTVCMTFHRTDSVTVEEAEKELVDEDDHSMYLTGNVRKLEVLS
jgi:hypothetical protein